MIKLIDDMPNGAIGLEAVGTVTAEDYDTVLRPTLEAALAAGDVRLLYVLGDDFDAYANGAWRNSADGAAAFKSIGAGHAQDRGSSDPMMHKTSTVDYIIVLKGEIYAVMETGEKLLRAGDILVQRGTNHSWSVRGNEPCIVAAVLVSAKPLGGPKKKPAKTPAKTARRKRK